MIGKILHGTGKTDDHKRTFYLKCGSKFNDLKGLAKHLRTMSHDVFMHHVNKEKNDFANWARNSLKEEGLAKKLEKKIDILETELEILRHMVDGKKPTKKKKKAAPKRKTPEKKPAPAKPKPKKKSPSKKI